MSYAIIDSGVADYIRRQLAIGFRSDVAEAAAEAFDADLDDCIRVAADVVATRHAEQATWPADTDCDKLDRAFAALDGSGVVARQHFSCCNTCGNSEMSEIIQDERERGKRVDGYVFYHWQDSDRALAGDGLMLRYHATNHEDADTAAIGQRVVAALRAEGLQSPWDGDPSTTIGIPQFDWKRRAPPAKPQPPSPTLDGLALRWHADLERYTASDRAVALGDVYAEAALACGDPDAAIAWARAHLVDRGRSSALAHVAALRGDAELAREAIACAAWNNGAMVDVILRLRDVAEPALWDAIRARVLDARHDVRGACEVAWYVVAAKLPPDEETRFIAGVTRIGADGHDDRLSAAIALDAAMVVLRERRGETAERRALCKRFESHCSGLDMVAVRAAIVALGAEIAHTVAERASTEVGWLADELLRRGADTTEIATHASAQARLARKAGGAFPDLAELRTHYEEGLYLLSDVRAAELEIAIARRDRDALAQVVRSVDEEIARPPREQGEPTATKLAAALAKWEGADARQRVGLFKVRREAAEIFRAARAAAARGDVAGGRALIERGLRGQREEVIDLYLAQGPLVAAWVAVGQLDDALGVAREHDLAADVIGPLAVALTRAGRTPEAIQLFAGALDRARTRAEIVALGPALDALQVG